MIFKKKREETHTRLAVILKRARETDESIRGKGVILDGKVGNNNITHQALKNINFFRPRLEN